MSILNADGWFLSEPNEPGSERPRSLRRVAVWQVRDDGSVVGLISHPRGPHAQHTTPTLKLPDGERRSYYVHWDDLTEEEQKQHLGADS